MILLALITAKGAYKAMLLYLAFKTSWDLFLFKHPTEEVWAVSSFQA